MILENHQTTHTTMNTRENLKAFRNAAHQCAMQMMENALYSQKKLPPVKKPDDIRAETQTNLNQKNCQLIAIESSGIEDSFPRCWMIRATSGNSRGASLRRSRSSQDQLLWVCISWFCEDV
jgi:hypothetical protein